MNQNFNYTFCKYDHGKTKDITRCSSCTRTCPSISNFIYGFILQLPIIKQITKLIYSIKFGLEMKAINKIHNEYGDCEDEDTIFLFGIKSYDDLHNCEANLYTMNDLELTFNKNSNKYSIDVETIYMFHTSEAKVNYYKSLLDQLTQYMNDNNLRTNYEFTFESLFYRYNTRGSFHTIEECYAVFKASVDAYTIMVSANSHDIDSIQEVV